MVTQSIIRDLNEMRSVEELAAYQKECRSAILALEDEYKGLPLPDEPRAYYASLKKANEEAGERAQELAARAKYVESLDDEKHATRAPDEKFFDTGRPTLREQDIYDLSTIRSRYGDPEGASSELRDRAKRAIELSRFPTTDSTRAKEHLFDLLETIDDPDAFARHILQTGSTLYMRAWGKQMSGTNLWPEEVRALALGTTGIPIPYTLDPTVLGVSNSSVNPYRAVASVKQITVDEWRGTTSAGITAAYAAEATEASDNAPTLAQPTVSTEKAQAFVPFSIEAGMDWPSLQAEMGSDLQDAKDDLEASKFSTGTGTNEPFGLQTGATNTVNATTGQTFDAEDIYRLEVALPPRYRPRASFVANRAIYNLTRQFDTGGGAQLWIRIGDGLAHGGALGEALLGYPTYEASGLASVTTTSTKFLYLGDMSRYVIVDRIGLSVEVIPHLFGSGNRYPTGQRGLYAYWRNGAKLIDANAVRVLIGLA